KLSMWIYPPYMNCTEGFLPDTIDIRRTRSIYDFRIFVQDSLPVFLAPFPTTDCDGVANLTDRLRFAIDLNTDDELEDSTVAAYTDSVSVLRFSGDADSTNDHQYAWDFRYGRTSYSGLIVPLWLKSALADANFKSKGKIRVDIDAATAYNMLTPTPQVNGELLLDTIASVEADDGHAGKRTLQWHAKINVEPTITTSTLPNAKEDQDYSHDTHDASVINRILITDPNFDDTHEFSLLYEGETRTIYRDSLYHAKGFTVDSVVLTGHTPHWLTINAASGVLSGTPGVTDAPRLPGLGCDSQDVVTVIVKDQCGLYAWKELILHVDSTQHLPTFARGPKVVCVTNKVEFCDSILVHDHDLLRNSCAAEELLFSASILGDSVSTVKVTPTSVKGPLATDTTSINVCLTFNLDDTYFSQDPIQPKFVQVIVDDQHGNQDTLRYEVIVGDVPTFECAVTVSNLVTPTHPKQDLQRLCFGAGRFGTDSLDVRYCEFEVPAAPNGSAFDGRWELPVGGSLKGTYIDIRKDTAQSSLVAWQIRFNSGSDDGGFYYPIRICWLKSCFDATGTFAGSFYLQHPFDPSEFSINMKTLGGPINTSNYTLLQGVGGKPDSTCLEIRNVGLSNARIVFFPKGIDDVEKSVGPQFTLDQNYPNPFASSTTLHFNVAERSKVKIEVFDIKGTLIRTLVNNEMIDASNTSYPIVWDGLDASGNEVAAGTYIAKMSAGDFSATVKMTLNK
ncbi:MAG TPA: FlgD immunoglobulin-like domain containing protein, partial [Candidatus Kapabacteria bacterium]|nr:FlgD immunoglobulin-like domain containing protein [Candidatus Kapabacteria bacterium]